MIAEVRRKKTWIWTSTASFSTINLIPFRLFLVSWQRMHFETSWFSLSSLIFAEHWQSIGHVYHLLIRYIRRRWCHPLYYHACSNLPREKSILNRFSFPHTIKMKGGNEEFLSMIWINPLDVIITSECQCLRVRLRQRLILKHSGDNGVQLPSIVSQFDFYSDFKIDLEASMFSCIKVRQAGHWQGWWMDDDNRRWWIA